MKTQNMHKRQYSDLDQKSSNSFLQSENISTNLKFDKSGQTNLQFQRKATYGMSDFKKFKYIDKIEKSYVFGKTLERGFLGVLRLCQHKDTGRKFNMKIIPKLLLQKQSINQEMFHHQLSILSEKSHPNIVRIIELLEDEETYYIVQENIKGQEILQRISKSKDFTEGHVADIIYQIMLGLNYLHNQKIIHKDLNPSNITFVNDDDECFEIKIKGIGVARDIDEKTQQ